MEGKKMNSEDKMVQITFKRQRKKRHLELRRLNRKEREMVETYWAGRGVTRARGLHRELTRLRSPASHG